MRLFLLIAIVFLFTTKANAAVVITGSSAAAAAASSARESQNENNKIIGICLDAIIVMCNAHSDYESGMNLWSGCSKNTWARKKQDILSYFKDVAPVGKYEVYANFDSYNRKFIIIGCPIKEEANAKP